MGRTSLRSLVGCVASLLMALQAASALGQTSVKLDIDTRRIVNETAYGDATLLFDEQAAIGDPRAGTGVAPVNGWAPGYNTWYYPVGAVVDLAGNCQLTDVSFYDANGSGQLTVQAWVNNAWVDLFTDQQTQYLKWVTKTLSPQVQARYVRILCYAGNVIPKEMVLYGWRIDTPEPYPNPVAQTPPTIEQFMGVNCVNTDPIGRMEAFGLVREYHDWSWDEAVQNQNKWYYSTTGNWNFDLFYTNLKKQQLTVLPCIQQSISWLGMSNMDYKPILVGSGRSTTAPASYVEHANHIYQFAARYGSTTVPDANLRLGAGEPRLSGMNLVKYLEDWNEEDKDWRDRDGLFLPYEYAAMASADVDGHQATMGTTVGMKNADPNIKFVMGGLAGIKVEYVKAMKFWYDRNRGGNFPIDVLNFHTYSNDAGGQFGQPTVGVSPETDNLKTKAAALVDYRNRFLPGKEVWCTEFGYDVNPASVQRAPAIGATPAEEVQGQWITRSFLALSAAGIDRAYLFMLRDPNTNDTTKYSSSGVIADAAHGNAVRPAWYYCWTLKERLRGLRFNSEQSSGNPNVLIYRFADSTGAIKAYAVWCPTSNNVTVPNYVLTLQGSPSSANLITLTNGQALGSSSALTISSGTVTINVSEKPVLVLTGAAPMMHAEDTKETLTPSMVTLESGGGTTSGLLADEQSSANPIYATATTQPSTAWSSSTYPASAYIDLGSTKWVSKVYLFDANNNADFTVSTGTPGNWTPVFTDDCRNYLSWNAHVINAYTRYLRFSRSSGAAVVSEVMVYSNPWFDLYNWTTTDIGGSTGTTTINGSSFTLTGNGRMETWYTSDIVHYTWRSITGDFTIQGKVSSVAGTPITCEGMFMARDGLAAGAPYVRVGLRRAHGWLLCNRAVANTAETDYRLYGPVPPLWIKMERRGNVFNGYRSTDGVSWTLQQSNTVALPSTVNLGLGAMSSNTTDIATVNMDQVTISQP